MHRNLRHAAHIVAALSFLATAPIAVHAGETFTMSVRAVHKNDKFELLAKDERTGRMSFFSTSKAVDREVKGRGLWNDSTRGTTAHWDMMNGIGFGHGFAKTEKGGGTVLVEWTGICYPVGGTEAKPTTYCSGGHFVVPGSGTGPFAGLKGGGTWTGTGGVDGNFVEEWAGVYEQ